MDTFENIKNEVFSVMYDYGVPEGIIDKLKNHQEKTLFIGTKKFLKLYRKGLRGKSVDLVALEKEINKIENKWNSYRYINSVASAIKAKFPDDNQIISQIMQMNNKDEVLPYISNLPHKYSKALKKKRIPPFDNKRQIRTPKSKGVNIRIKNTALKLKKAEEKYTINKAKILVNLKRRKVSQDNLEFIDKLTSLESIKTFIEEVLPVEAKYLKKRQIPPFISEKRPKKNKKESYVKIIYTPMGNKR